MVRYESQCVDCGYPCRGSSCPNYEVEIICCDECGKEIDDVYDVDGDELCEECCLKRFRRDL